MIVEPSKGVTARDFAHKASSGAPLHHHPSKHLTSPSAAHPHAVMRHDDHIQRLYIGPHLSEFLPASSGTDPASLRRLARSRHEVGKLWKHAIRHGHEGKKGKVEMKWKGGSFVIGEDMREAYWDSLAAEKDEVGRVGSSKDMLVAPKRTESPPPMLKEEREEVDDIGKGKGREEDRKITPDSPDVFLKQLSPPQSPGKSLDGRSPSGADLDVKHGNLHERLSRAASAAPSKPSSDTAVEADDHRPETSTAKVKRSKSARFAEPEEAIGDPRRPRGDDVPIPPEEVLGRDQDVQAPPQTVDSRSSAEEETFFRRDRMLVRQGWAARETLPTPFDAKFARELQVTWYRWQEFAVVYRRQRLEIWERPRALSPRQLRGQLSLRHVIPLHNSKTSLSLYNHSEPIICLTISTETHKAATHRWRSPTHYVTDRLRSQGTSIFLLRPLTPSLAADWFFDLWQELGGETPRQLTVSLPDLHARLVLPIPEDAADPLADDWRSSRRGEYTSAGYTLMTPAKVIERCTKLIDSVGEWRALHDERGGDDMELALAWRNDDIVTWIVDEDSADGERRGAAIMAGYALQQSRRVESGGLELRAANHYPDAVKDSSGHRLVEPSSIEGFLERVHGKTGTRRERLYLVTEGSHLFIVEAKNAHPPEPPLKVASDTPARDRLALFGGAYHRGPAGEDDVSKYLLKLTGSRETGSTIGEEEVDETELRETVVERFVESEKTRSCKLVEAARGYVDLRAIVEVRRTSANGSPRAERANDASLGADEDESDDEELASEPDAASRDVRSFEVELENGRIAHFEARTEQDAAAWIKHLTSLSAYWRARKHADALEQMATQPGNAFRARSAYRDAAIGAHDPLDPFAARPDPAAYSRSFDFCTVRGCRGILRVGRLYSSARGTARSKERWYVLVQGGLLAFKVAKTKALSGTEVPSVFHGRAGKKIDLAGAYILTGSVCKIDERSTGENPFDGEREGKVFADGLIAFDNEAQCTFELWRPTSKKVGSLGTVLTFRARSRTERDAWAYAIGREMERFARITSLGRENIGKTER